MTDLSIVSEQIDMKKVFEYQPYVFYRRHQFTVDKIENAFVCNFAKQVFVRQIKVFYPQIELLSYKDKVLLEIFDLPRDLGFQQGGYCAFHVSCWKNDIQYSMAPNPVDNNAFGVNFSSVKLGSSIAFDIPLEFNSPVNYKLSVLGTNKPTYVDLYVKTYVKSGR